ncbi:unnamed protein product, partial [Rotaria magnacalcarata]
MSLVHAAYIMKKNIDVLKQQHDYLSQEQASIQNAIQHIQSAALAGPAGQGFPAWWAQPGGIDWQQIPTIIAGLRVQLD